MEGQGARYFVSPELYCALTGAVNRDPGHDHSNFAFHDQETWLCLLHIAHVFSLSASEFRTVVTVFAIDIGIKGLASMSLMNGSPST